MSGFGSGLLWDSDSHVALNYLPTTPSIDLIEAWAFFSSTLLFEMPVKRHLRDIVLVRLAHILETAKAPDDSQLATKQRDGEQESEPRALRSCKLLLYNSAGFN